MDLWFCTENEEFSIKSTMLNLPRTLVSWKHSFGRPPISLKQMDGKTMIYMANDQIMMQMDGKWSKIIENNSK